MAWYNFRKKQRSLAEANAELLEKVELLTIDLECTAEEVREQLEAKEMLKDSMKAIVEALDQRTRELCTALKENEKVLEAWVCEKQRAELAEQRLQEMTVHRSQWLATAYNIVKLSGQITAFKEYNYPKPKLDWE